MQLLIHPAGGVTKATQAQAISFTLKPLASKRNPYYYEWSSLSFMHGTYLIQQHYK